MIRVTHAIEASATLRRFEEHPVTARVRWAIGYAMRDDVNVNARPKRFVQTFAASAVNDFFNGKVRSLGVLAMEECRGDPHFIGDLQLGESLVLHEFLFMMF
jgi:hypothetical protein